MTDQLKKLHIISTGSYSDYNIEAILAQQPRKDFDALVQEFDAKTLAAIGEPPDDDVAWDAWFESRKSHWGGLAREEALVVWLKAEYGYVEYEFDDKNI